MGGIQTIQHDRDTKVDTGENSIVYRPSGGKIHTLCYDVIMIVIIHLDPRYWKDVELAHPLFRMAMSIDKFRTWKEYYFIHIKNKVGLKADFFSPRFESFESIEKEANSSYRGLLWKKIVLFYHNSLLTFSQRWTERTSHSHYRNRVMNWKGFYYSIPSDANPVANTNIRNIYFPASKATFSDITLSNFQPFDNSIQKNTMLSFECRIVAIGSRTNNHVGECLSAPKRFFSPLIDLVHTPSLIFNQDQKKHEVYHAGMNIFWEGEVLKNNWIGSFCLSCSEEEEMKFRVFYEYNELQELPQSRQTKMLARSLKGGDKVFLLGQLRKDKAGVSLFNLKISNLGDSFVSSILLKTGLFLFIGTVICSAFALPLVFVDQFRPSPTYLFSVIRMIKSFPVHFFNGFCLGLGVVGIIHILGILNSKDVQKLNEIILWVVYFAIAMIPEKYKKVMERFYTSKLDAKNFYFLRIAILLVLAAVFSVFSFLVWLISYFTLVWIMWFRASCGILILSISIERLKDFLLYLRRRKMVSPPGVSRESFLNENYNFDDVYNVLEMNELLDEFCSLERNKRRSKTD